MNYSTNIQTGESYKDYKIRLSRNKELYELTWQDIANLLNKVSGDTFTESTYRRWWKENKNIIDNLENDSSLDIKALQLEKAKIKFYDQRREFNKLVRLSARKENLYEIVTNSLKNIEPIDYSYKISNIEESNNDLFVGLNDIHYGANIDNHWNTYNPLIAKKRMKKYLEDILSIKNIHHSENCYVCANGDLISGKIHYTIEISNCENVIEQVKGVSELLSWFLKCLSENFKNVYFSVVSGNHSRLGEKDKSPKDERLDDLIPWYIQSRLQNIPNFEVLENKIDSTVNLIDIRGLKYANVHGDYDGFSTIQKLTNMINENIYCVHFGHKHYNYTSYNQRVKIIMSGSLQGMDDFCIEKRIYGKAQQLIGVCTEDGMVCTYDIDLQ